jgi:hypothetical protein
MAKDISFLDDIGGDKGLFTPVNKSATSFTEKGLLHAYGRLVVIIEDEINRAKLTASGALVNSLDGVLEKNEGATKVLVYMADYYDYVNQGVRGVRSGKNAPGSPYQYKNYGMSKAGLTTLKAYINSGKAKISSVRKDVALGIGHEKKGVGLLDAKVQTLAFLIKAFGIKKTDYFTKAMKRAAGEMDKYIVEGMGKDFHAAFNQLKLGKK